MWESTTCLSCSGAHFPCQPCRPVDMIHVSPVPVWTRTLGEHPFVRQDSKGGGRPSVRLNGGSLSFRTVSFCSGIFLQESLLRHPRPNLVTRRLSNIPEILQSGAGITFHRRSQHNQPTKELVTGTATTYTSNIHHRVFTTIQFFRPLSIIYGQILSLIMSQKTVFSMLFTGTGSLCLRSGDKILYQKLRSGEIARTLC